ncbi:hypothetical protein NIE88_18985 [Sporolactobacillus shoreicorticis]|uniref:Uncharacterized protein n=1 Tax=Sporolactobacillus shoreicorticis TaxID=1923877 RepID=A0ABW5S6Z4_9BACL|nr:hypothetical protein [Sporolactobacillus shoreicorticis]MCO7127836.1 hypothetical protein [Sporolactobacillus shoreicorticis]
MANKSKDELKKTAEKPVSGINNSVEKAVNFVKFQEQLKKEHSNDSQNNTTLMMSY